MKSLVKGEGSPSFKNILSYLILFLVPVASFYGMEFFLCNPFVKQKVSIQILNILFFEIFTLLGLFLFKKAKYILRIQSVIFCLIGLVNYFILSFRGTPFMPWDLFSFKTAAAVADNYNYTIDTGAFLIILVFVGLFFLSGWCDIIVKAKNFRLSAFLICLCFLWTLFSYVQSDHAPKTFGLYDKLFTPTTMTFRNGTVVTLILQSKYLSVDKPEGYSPQKAQEILASFAQKEETSFSTDSLLTPPNIIVIMNEAFSDLNLLGDFSTNEDYLPFVHTLMKGQGNTLSGIANVSVLGGNTANSEYEFLTSHTMAFLPQGSVPYQQYIKKETFSLASYLKSFGYKTIALHPYGASGWQRDVVYPLLGFDEFYSLEDFHLPPKIRKYVSDEENYEKIKELYENREKGKPLFLFNVTMQNHSSYTESFDNFIPSVTVDGSDRAELSTYLSLLKISDQKIRELLSYFEKQEERVLLLFFGDHQPTDSVVRDIWLQNKKDPASLSLEDQMLRYQVPFFLWANYPISESHGLESSLNYLTLRVLENANLPLNSYYHFLSNLEKEYPVISALQTKDSSFTSREVKEVKKELNPYAQVQYFQIFD